MNDPSEYDNNGDGYLDGVMLVTNIPSDRNRPNYTFRLEQGDEKYYPANAWLGSYVDVHASELDPYSDTYTDNAAPHELSHAMGLQDYYDYYGMSGVATHFDIMSGVGDWNTYSKMAVGWIDPYVITPDVEKVTIKLRNSAEYPDAIRIACHKNQAVADAGGIDWGHYGVGGVGLMERGIVEKGPRGRPPAEKHA